MASPPSSIGLEEPWQPCRGQPHGAPLTWTFQPAILAERGPSAPSGMRPPAAARLAGCGGAMGAALPVDGSSAQQGAGGAAATGMLAVVSNCQLYSYGRVGVSGAPKPLFLGAAHSAPARRIQAFLVSGLERTGPGNQGGVTVTYTGTPGHNGGL